MTRDRVQSFRAPDARGLLRARRLASAWLIVAAAALTSTGVLDARQAPSPEILAKAAAHVQHFIAGMSNVVAVETYEQAQQTNGMRAVTLSTRRTRADLLVLPLGESGWVPFRDVYEVDGQRVRDRDDRLTRLLGHLDDAKAVEQAVAISNESARFNLNPGFVDRTINTPMTALMFLQADNQSRSSFSTDGRATIGKVACEIVSFVEQRTPSLIQSPYAITVRGRFWIEPATGAVLRSELRANAALNANDTQTVRAIVTVNYTPEPKLGIWVPASMDETYDVGVSGQITRGQSLTGHAEYSGFRTFGVTTETSVH
ncbi:MAG TPA: hypothetical protein VHB78_14455 [Vicinamibacterales bacterium]|jgi:hypothetical protein|nr:hypothetical protein [Vicinamibacterales bacterium]